MATFIGLVIGIALINVYWWRVIRRCSQSTVTPTVALFFAWGVVYIIFRWLTTP